MKSIVIYYSRSGKTEAIAKKLEETFESELLKVEPAKEYTTFVSAVSRVVSEKKEQKVVEFMNEIPTLSPYELIFIGYPIWANDMPDFMAEFIHHLDLEGKTIIPFCTFAMNDIDKSLLTLRAVAPNAKIEIPYNYGLLKKDSYDEWVKQIKDLLLKRKERKIL